MTPITPLDAPATPAAQPYGTYTPTPHDQAVAAAVQSLRGALIFSTGDQAVVTGRANGRIH
jgi:hypothetical protein